MGIVFSARKVFVQGEEHRWRAESTLVQSDIKIHFESRFKAIIELTEIGVRFVVLRHMSPVPSAKKVNFLGFYVENDETLSRECSGILGNKYFRIRIL